MFLSEQTYKYALDQYQKVRVKMAEAGISPRSFIKSWNKIFASLLTNPVA